jgi:hypothetical protein
MLEPTPTHVLPSYITKRQGKTAFITPEGVWFRGALRARFKAEFRRPSFLQQPHRQPDKMMRLLKAHVASQTGCLILLSRSLNIVLWRRRFIDRRPVQPEGTA